MNASFASMTLKFRNYNGLDLTPQPKMAPSSSALDYNTCTLSELRKFAIARTSSISDPKKTTNSHKKKLAKLLRKPDATATFPKFFDLPLELREQVYRFWLQQFKNKVWRGQLIPRLKLVSDQFCEEALVVYDTARYDLSTSRLRYLSAVFTWRSPDIVHTADLDAFMGCSYGDDRKDEMEELKIVYKTSREHRSGAGSSR